MTIKFETVVEYAKRPTDLCAWVESLGEADLLEVQHIMLTRQADIHEALQDWADEVGVEGINDAIDTVQRSNSESITQYIELQEEYENQFGIDCTEANDFINRVKKESL